MAEFIGRDLHLVKKALAIAVLAIERQPGPFQSSSDQADMKTLLDALIGPDVDEMLRDGARHVLTDNASPRVRELSVPLIKALKGPQADIAAMQEALKLMALFR